MPTDGDILFHRRPEFARDNKNLSSVLTLRHPKLWRHLVIERLVNPRYERRRHGQRQLVRHMCDVDRPLHLDVRLRLKRKGPFFGLDLDAGQCLFDV